MSKHTPGPWNYYTEPQPNGCPIIGNKTGLMVAMLAHSINHPDQCEEAEANARLIAAAPDLLAFAQVIADLVIVPPMMTEQARQLMWLQDISRVVIANATGEQP